MSKTPPLVTVAVPTYNEEKYIAACLQSFLSQDYPAERIEVLVADGGSEDRTREIVGRIAASDPRVRLLDNSKYRIQSCGLNLCIRESKGEFILVAVAHAEYAHDYVSVLVREFQRTGADVAGGAQRIEAQTYFQKALRTAFDSPLAVGGAPFRSAEAEGWVDTVFPGAFRRSILEKVGLYDARAVTNEDAELQQRALAAGGKIYLSKDVVVRYFPRKTIFALSRQYFRYGEGRARTFLIHKRFPVLRPAIPFLALLTGLSLAAIPLLQFLLVPAFAAYFAAISFEAWRHGRKAGLWAIPVVWTILPTLHFSHAIGFAQGLAKYTVFPRPPMVEKLEPRSPQTINKTSTRDPASADFVA